MPNLNRRSGGRHGAHVDEGKFTRSSVTSLRTRTVGRTVPITRTPRSTISRPDQAAQLLRCVRDAELLEEEREHVRRLLYLRMER